MAAVWLNGLMNVPGCLAREPARLLRLRLPTSFLSRSLLLFLLFTYAGMLVIQAQNQTLIDFGSTWRWRKGTNEVSNPITAWRTNGFDDST